MGKKNRTEKKKVRFADIPLEQHEAFMLEALKEADIAASLGEVPVGAVVVRDGQIIGRGGNRRETLGDPSAHAEILALRDAAETVGGWYLHSCVLYCTLEPCPMCAGALMQARMEGVCFGAQDAKAGACGSVIDLPGNELFPHTLWVHGGILEQPSLQRIQDFFRTRR